MKLSTVLYIVGLSSLGAAAPLEDEEPAVPVLPSFSRAPVPSFSRAPLPSLPPRPSGTGKPPVFTPPARPSRTRSFVISVRPTPPVGTAPVPSVRPSRTRSIGLPPKPTPGEDDGDDDDDDE
ncbi:hypothetical protein EK21DRAFT_107601 [Setomelanomma holmii]|uniref:Uncharacterized protein n=1 Tax=Setomelanomma holmii TaxID=210430 RepID=A0A9P4HL35_9PLEO|nr:hypothetical protein EK21DRAFT_107601 [Setomelanomma holmii]